MFQPIPVQVERFTLARGYLPLRWLTKEASPDLLPVREIWITPGSQHPSMDYLFRHEKQFYNHMTPMMMV